MKLRDEQPAPEGCDTWQPRMGRGGKVIALVVLAMIAAGSALMLWQSASQWFG